MSKEKVIYNLNTLNNVVKRDQCVLKQDYSKVNANIRIHFVCGEQDCNEEYDKKFMHLFVSGGYCKKCTQKRKMLKMKETNIKKYGCENVFQNEDIKDKIINNNIEKYGVRSTAQLETTKEKYKQTMLDKYGVENGFQAEELKKKAKETMIEKYGCENPQQCPTIKEKTKKTVQEIYGCSNPMQNVEVQKKGKETNIIKYGCENPFQANECKEKSKETCMDKYGCEYASQSTEFKEKIRNTNIERYGVPNVSQNPEIIDKQFKRACKLKDYIYPCGKVIQVQGYEPFALDDLLAQGYSSFDIITERKEVPEIWYEKDGTQRRYFCDIYIPTENRIIEVKSDYTYQHSSGNVEEKAKASVACGYGYEVWVYSRNGNKNVVNYYTS